MVTTAIKLKEACSLEEKLWQTDLEGVLKSRDFTLITKVHIVQAMVFPVVKCGCDSWSIKLNTEKLMLSNCGAGEDSLESPLDCMEIKPVNPKGNQLWLFIGRTVAEAEAPVLWPPDVKSQLIRKDLDAGKDWGQEMGMMEDKMVGWHYWLNGHEFEQAPGDGEGQGSLVCCSTWSRKDSGVTEQLNNNNNQYNISTFTPLNT